MKRGYIRALNTGSENSLCIWTVLRRLHTSGWSLFINTFTSSASHARIILQVFFILVTEEEIVYKKAKVEMRLDYNGTNSNSQSDSPTHALSDSKQPEVFINIWALGGKPRPTMPTSRRRRRHRSCCSRQNHSNRTSCVSFL